MKKITNMLCLASLVMGLAACATQGGGAQNAPSGSSSDAFGYYSQTVAVNANGSYEQLNTARYSKMHLIQSSYLFQ